MLSHLQNLYSVEQDGKIFINWFGRRRFGLFQAPIPSFTWRDWRKLRKAQSG